MVKIGLQIKADLENILELKPKTDVDWFLKCKCTYCGNEYDKWKHLSINETYPIKGSRGKANLVSTCKLCLRENSISIIADSIKSYKYQDNLDYQTIVTFDCRGMEPIDFDPRTSFLAITLESNTMFDDVNLKEKEWVDYDEKSSQSVGVYNLNSKMIKL